MGTMSGNILGLAGELRVMSELLLRGHNPAKSYLEDGADIVLENGLRIEVKSAHKLAQKRTKAYFFSLRGGHRKEKQDLSKCGAIICWCIDEDCFYIIPSIEIQSSAIAIYDTSGSKSKYASYRNNWELLKGR